MGERGAGRRPGLRPCYTLLKGCILIKNADFDNTKYVYIAQKLLVDKLKKNNYNVSNAVFSSHTVVTCFSSENTHSKANMLGICENFLCLLALCGK